MTTSVLILATSCSLAVACLDNQGQVADASPSQTDGNLESGDTATTADTTHPVDSATSETSSAPDTRPPDPECEATGSACSGAGACCSHICTGNADNDGYCIEPVEDNQYCGADSWCQSGRCVESTCIPEACWESGKECVVSASCCSGICSYTGPYMVDSTCIEARQLGEACSRDNWCASGFCVNGMCAVGACLEVGSDCSWDANRCCYPSFCNWNGGYAPGYCTAPQRAGAYCNEATWCASGMCTSDGFCK